MAKAGGSKGKAAAGSAKPKTSKTSSGSALSQRPHSKPANLTSAQASSAVRRYLAKAPGA